MSFPNLKGKHSKQSMVEPSDSIRYMKKMEKLPRRRPPEGVIICYNSGLMDYITQNHKTTEIRGFAGPLYLLEETKNRVGVIGKFGIGAPVAVTVLEELIAYGSKRFITIGNSGSLQRDLAPGDIVVCTRAIRDEGTSHHYKKHSKYSYPSKEMTERIKRSLEALNQKYRTGTTWTIDAPYRETVAEARGYQKEGVLTVEMEASALFAVAGYRGVDIGGIFTISDSLAELEWNPQFHHDSNKKSLEVLYSTALNALRK